MSTQTRPHIGDRIRVVSVESDILRSYVGRLGTVSEPKRIPNGAQDKIFVQLDRARKQKPVNLFLKPEDLTTDIDSPILSGVTATEVQQTDVQIEGEGSLSELLELEVGLSEINTRIEEAESSLSQLREVETGSNGQCNQDSRESSGGALGICQIDSQPSTCAVGLARDSRSECLSLEDLSSLDLPILTSIAAISSQSDSQEFATTATCEDCHKSATTSTDQEESTSSLRRRHANHLALRDSGRDGLTQETALIALSGRSPHFSPNLRLSKTSQGFSLVPTTQLPTQAHVSGTYSLTFTAAGMMQNGFVSTVAGLERPGLGKDCYWLPRPGALSSSSSKSRPPGSTKFEDKCRKLGLIQKTEVANPEFLESAFGLPIGWTDPLESRAATVLLASVEQPSGTALTQDKQRSHSLGFSTLTPSSEAPQGFVVGDRIRHRFAPHEGTVVRPVDGEVFVLWDAHPNHETLYRNEDLCLLSSTKEHKTQGLGTLQYWENFTEELIDNSNSARAVEGTVQDIVDTDVTECHRKQLCENFPKRTLGKTWIDPHEVNLHAGTQSRYVTDWETVERYAELMRENHWDWKRSPLPVVFQDRSVLHPGDGHHRIEAAIIAGVDLICVELRAGTTTDAIMHSCAANTMHGLPLRPRDQRRRIELFLDTCLTLPEGDERKAWSSREIARYLGLSEAGYRTVCNILSEREMSAKISHFNEGDRVQVVRNAATGSGGFWPEGTLGKVQELDKKKGVLVVPDMAAHLDRWMLSNGWIHPDNLIKSDAPWSSGKISQHEEKDSVESPRAESGSALSPQVLVGEPKSKDKQLLPDVKRNSDHPPETQLPVSAALANRSAITNGKPDVVATEIAIGVKHLTPEGLLHVMEAIAHHHGAEALGNLLIESVYKDEVADFCNKCLDAMDKKAFSWLEVEKINFSGLSDAALKLLIKGSKRSLNERHNPEYFNNCVAERSCTQHRKDALDASKVQVISRDEDANSDDEGLTLGAPELDWEPDDLNAEKFWEAS